jgi:hypothetical protein
MIIEGVIDRLYSVFGYDTVHRINQRMNYISGESSIHGEGLFAARDFEPGEYIGRLTDVYRKGAGPSKVTHMASKINHSWNPNCRVQRQETPRPTHTYMYHDLYSLTHINEGDELTVNYNEYPEFKDANPKWK